MNSKVVDASPPSDKVRQEFFCRTSGGGCGGYITVKLNMSLDGAIKVICPKCKHEHERLLQGGKIVDDKSRGKQITQEILPTLAAWSPTPKAGVGILPLTEGKRNKDDFEDGHSVILEHHMRELWFERFGKTN